MTAIFWFVLMIVFIFMETNTVSLVSIWFALGALVSMIAAIFGVGFWVELILFVAVSAVALAALRPVTKKYFTPKITKTNVDSLVGQQGLITAAVDNVQGCGTVKLGGIEWTARSTDGAPIPEGKLVTVDRIEGVKAFVTEVK